MWPLCLLMSKKKRKMLCSCKESISDQLRVSLVRARNLARKNGVRSTDFWKRMLGAAEVVPIVRSLELLEEVEAMDSQPSGR